MACNECQQQTPCTQEIPCGNCKIKLDSSCITYDGEALTCLGLEENENLTTLIETLSERVCANEPSIQNAIVNIGTGEGIYAGNNNSGARQLKSLKDSVSIDFSSTSTEISARVNTTWLSGQGIASVFPENIVEFSTNDPNTIGTIFTPDVPQDPDALYWSDLSNALFKYDTPTNSYVESYVAPNSTPFYYGSSNIDAGGNKEAPIKRNGSIGIGINPSFPLHVSGTIAQTAVTSSVLKTNSNGALIAAVANTDYLTPTGSAASLTNFPILNQNTTGSAATVTTIPNLTGDVTSVGNTTTLNNTAVIAGTYTAPTITINSQGRITSAINGGGSGALADFFTTQQNTGSALNTLYTYTLPANKLVINGDKIFADFGGSFANTNAKTISFGIGGNIYSFNVNVAGAYQMEIIIIRSTSTTGSIGVKLVTETATYLKNATFTVSGWVNATAISLSTQAVATGDVVARLGTIRLTPASS